MTQAARSEPLLAVCAGLGLLVGVVQQHLERLTRERHGGFRVVPGRRSRPPTASVTDQGASRRHRVAVADGDRDAVRHRGRQPGQGGRQVLRLPQAGAAHDARRPLSRTSRPSCRTGPTSSWSPATAAGLTARLKTFGIPVLSLPPAATLADAYAQYDQLGQATGHAPGGRGRGGAREDRRSPQIVRDAPKSNVGQTYYYELDQTYFSVTSSTFIGKVLGLLGLRNIADRAPSAASSGGYPQLVGRVHRAVEPRLGVPGRHHLLRADVRTRWRRDRDGRR